MSIIYHKFFKSAFINLWLLQVCDRFHSFPFSTPPCIYAICQVILQRSLTVGRGVSPPLNSAFSPRHMLVNRLMWKWHYVILTQETLYVSAGLLVPQPFSWEENGCARPLIRGEWQIHRDPWNPLLCWMEWEGGGSQNPIVSTETFGLYLLLQRHRMAQSFTDPSLGDWRCQNGGWMLGSRKLTNINYDLIHN